MGIQDTMLKKSTLKGLLESPWRAEETYVTAGAYMCCTRGTHEEVLNTLEPNGVYINGSPMLTVQDCKVSTSEPGMIMGTLPFDTMSREIDGNFYSFGYCRSEMHPLKVSEKTLGFTDPSYLVDSDAEEPTVGQFIYPCAPKLMPTVLGASPAASNPPALQATLPGAPSALTTLLARVAGAHTEWTNGSSNVSIQGTQALTSKSCLFCQYGGQIRILTNGMDPAPPEFSAR
jgi:hypothetical protein